MKKLKIWWLRLKFRIRYPVRFTNNLVWIEAFNQHLKNLKKLEKN
jgi:hypothetical protein